MEQNECEKEIFQRERKIKLEKNEEKNFIK
jgi:hypothetical protein